MKKLALSVFLMAFAIAAQAGDTKTTKTTKIAQDKDQAPCCAAKAKATADAKGTCSESTKMACSGGACKDMPTKQALMSPKAAAEIAKR